MGSQECDQNGVLRSYSGSPPCHCSLKVDSFPFMTENSVHGYESEKFDAGGHKWKLVIYQNGNKKRNVEDHTSLYLEMAGEHSLQGDWEIYVDFRLFLLDQKRGKYLVLEGKHCFSAMSSSWGLPKFVSLSTFYEASKGLLMKNTSILEVEITVHGIATVL